MTPANVRRLNQCADRLRDLAKRHRESLAQDAACSIIDTMQEITNILQDLILRPDVNDGLDTPRAVTRAIKDHY